MDDSFPSEVDDVIRLHVRRHPDDIDAAVAAAVEKIYDLPDSVFKAAVRPFVVKAVRERSYDFRDRDNREIRKSLAAPVVGPARVKVGASPAINQRQLGVYAYRIGGRQLGSLLGKELLPLAAGQRAIARGHDCLADLLERLAPMVPAEKAVRDSVAEKKVEKLARECSLEIAREAEPLALAGH